MEDVKHHTKADMLHMLAERLEEELEDVVTYGELYKHLIAHEMYDEADLVEEIARDEYSHATALCEHLKDIGEYPTDEKYHKLWHEAKMYFD